MEFGVHLPLLAFRGQAFSLSRLVDYTETAERLGFTTLCANDHLIFSRPWLDSLMALAAILTKTRHMTLMTTVALPTVQGYEVMNMIRKGQRQGVDKGDILSQVAFITRLFGVVA